MSALDSTRWWRLEPLEPLIFGQGQPNSAVPGATGGTLALPPPSQLAGAVRARVAAAESVRTFDDAVVARLRRVPAGGPLLLQGDSWVFPAPRDLLRVKGVDYPLVPLELPAGASASGAPVGTRQPLRDKPEPPELFWRWAELESWLCRHDRNIAEALPQVVGQTRFHVAIDPSVGTAAEGQFYATRARVFPRGLDLAARGPAALPEGAGVLGGEQRLVRWSPAPAFPKCPPAVVASAREGAVRVFWATPAVFTEGQRGRWLLEAAPPGSAWVAQVNDRPLVFSGWDLKTRSRKPTRRALPAGAVSWLRLGGSAEERAAFVERCWGEPASDLEQDRLDGFGAVLFGAWNGKLSPLET